MTGLPLYATDPKMTGQMPVVEKPQPTGRDGFTAYMDKIAGGAKWKDGVMIDGPFKGLDKNGLMSKAREQYAALPDADKQIWQTQSTGQDMEVGGRPVVAAKTGSGPGGGLRSGSVSASSGLDWLAANRTTGDALKQQEANVGNTGDRFKGGPAPVEKPVIAPKPAAMAGQPLAKTGYDPMGSVFAPGGELAKPAAMPTDPFRKGPNFEESTPVEKPVTASLSDPNEIFRRNEAIRQQNKKSFMGYN